MMRTTWPLKNQKYRQTYGKVTWHSKLDTQGSTILSLTLSLFVGLWTIRTLEYQHRLFHKRSFQFYCSQWTNKTWKSNQTVCKRQNSLSRTPCRYLMSKVAACVIFQGWYIFQRLNIAESSTRHSVLEDGLSCQEFAAVGYEIRCRSASAWQGAQWTQTEAKYSINVQECSNFRISRNIACRNFTSMYVSYV